MSIQVFSDISVLWKEVFTFLRGHGCRHHEAEDLTQEVFMTIANKDGFEHLGNDHANHSMLTRNYVFKAARNALIDQRRRAAALKRGGTAAHVSTDNTGIESNMPIDHRSPDHLAQVHEVHRHVDRHLDQLGKEMTKQGKAGLFQELRSHLIPGQASTSYAKSARSLGVHARTLRVQSHRWRECLISRVRAEFAA